ncbi:MAG: bifunctional precorrin-2 dehydrogenase/sirohydrochlorin ferrochelatase, partial [Desulfobacterales bacterium]|nr:bifunctional precorrin-2 dehydrogenase/sirohydrochlorin ferrochelatase [Desulfobacterales bacterium]
MKYFPLFLDIDGKSCLVVGGGEVGARKAGTLDRCGAGVTVVSPAFSERFKALAHRITCIRKKYEPGDIEGMSLVFAATDNARLNRRIQQDARERSVWCNVADGPGHSDFILPSVIERGDLILAVSTSGSSPALARKIRLELEEIFGPEYEKILRVMGGIRKKLLASGHAPETHKKLFYTLIESGMLEWIKDDETDRINIFLAGLLGKDYT